MRKLTTDEVKTEIHKAVGNEYSLLKPYKNAQVKLTLRHNKCGRVFRMSLSEFRKGYRCPYCYQEHKDNKKAQQFKHRVHSLVGNEYTILVPFKNNRTKVKMRHNKCGYCWWVAPEHFLNGSRCPYCSKFYSPTKTTKEFKEDMYNLIGNKYTLLTSYKNSDTKVKIRHNKCGYIWTVRPDTFLMGARCPYCWRIHLSKWSTKHNRLTTSQYKKKIYKLFGNEYSVLSRYKDAHHRVTIRHNKCGYIWHPMPFWHGCPRCAFKRNGLKRRTTNNEFKQEVAKLRGSDYTVIGRFKGFNHHVLIRHNKCGRCWKTNPGRFLYRDARCPYCTASNGEVAVGHYLKSHHLHYIYGYRLHNSSISRHRLHLDFYLPNKDIGIEFDGQQHFKPVKWFGGKRTFKNVKKNDKKKNRYCELKHIHLIRIENYKYRSIKSIKKLVTKTLNNALLSLLK